MTHETESDDFYGELYRAARGVCEEYDFQHAIPRDNKNLAKMRAAMTELGDVMKEIEAERTAVRALPPPRAKEAPANGRRKRRAVTAPAMAAIPTDPGGDIGGT